jgi:hypothetical protein
LIEAETDCQGGPTAAKTQGPVLPQQHLGVRVEYWETDIRDQLKAAGGIWRPRHKLWEMRYEDVVALGLESRVVGNGFSES